MKNIFNKFFYVIIVFLIFLLILCTTCFASNPDLTVKFPDGINRTFIFNNELISFKYFGLFVDSSTPQYGYYFTFVGTNYDFYLNDNNYFNFTDGLEHDFYIYNFNPRGTSAYDNCISQFNNLSLDNLSYRCVDNICTTPIIVSMRDNTFFYFNTDIKNKNGDVVFQGAPVTVEQVTIPAIQQAEEIPQAMKEVLRILIPVGLIIFGIGLVIFLIRYLRSRLM